MRSANSCSPWQTAFGDTDSSYEIQIADTLHIFLSDLVGDLRRVAEAGDVVGLDGDADVAIDIGAVLLRHDEGGGRGGRGLHGGGGHLKSDNLITDPAKVGYCV